jgi:hypothetical protein
VCPLVGHPVGGSESRLWKNLGSRDSCLPQTIRSPSRSFHRVKLREGYSNVPKDGSSVSGFLQLAASKARAKAEQECTVQ